MTGMVWLGECLSHVFITLFLKIGRKLPVLQVTSLEQSTFCDIFGFCIQNGTDFLVGNNIFRVKESLDDVF